MYKKILVPLDGSKRAEAILPHVEELAHNFEAQVVFLRVIEPHYVYTDSIGYAAANVEEISLEAKTQRAEYYLAEIIGKFRRKSIKGKSIVLEGSVSHTIMKIAERENIDLIAMASHGRSGLSRVFYGSVAASVLHLVDRPLLLIRA
jgi:nucleotide-binding universal stress UspA family protein